MFEWHKGKKKITVVLERNWRYYKDIKLAVTRSQIIDGIDKQGPIQSEEKNKFWKNGKQLNVKGSKKDGKWHHLFDNIRVHWPLAQHVGGCWWKFKK